MTEQKNIRNFSIIAHIDHRKSFPQKQVFGDPFDLKNKGEMNSPLFEFAMQIQRRFSFGGVSS